MNEPKLMKGQRCKNSEFVHIVWHYCHFFPPSRVTEVSSISRQSIGKIYLKLGKRIRHLIPDEFLEQVYAPLEDFATISHQDSLRFGDIFYDGLTDDYFDYIRNVKKSGPPIDAQPIWHYAEALNECWGGVPRDTFAVHISVAIFRVYLTLHLLTEFEYAQQTNAVDEFYAGLAKKHPNVPCDIEQLKNFNHITSMMTNIVIDHLLEYPLT